MLALLLVVSIPEKPIRARSNEPFRWHMHQKAFEKHLAVERVQRLLISARRLTAPERDLVVLIRLDPFIRDRHPVHVARQIPDQPLRSTERRLRVHLPPARPHSRQKWFDLHRRWQILELSLSRSILHGPAQKHPKPLSQSLDRQILWFERHPLASIFGEPARRNRT